MENSNKQQEYIHKYIYGELTEEEQIRFEEKLLLDSEFKKLFDEEKRLLSAIYQAQKKINNDKKTDKNRKTESAKIKKLNEQKWYIKLAIAASIIFPIIIIYQFFEIKKLKNNANIFSSTEQSYIDTNTLLSNRYANYKIKKTNTINSILPLNSRNMSHSTEVLSLRGSLYEDINKADSLYEEGNYNEALKLYLPIGQGSSKIYEKIGDCYYKTNNPESAIYYYKISALLNPDTYIYNKISDCYKKLGIIDSANIYKTKAEKFQIH